MASWVPLKAGSGYTRPARHKSYIKGKMIKMQAGGFPIARQIPSKHFKFLAGSPECFQKLMELYEKGAVPPMAQPGPDGPRVLQMGFRDGTSQHEIFRQHGMVH